MHSCHRDDVARFLAGLLNTAEESTFVDHLETCPCCCEWLEKDSGSDQHWQWARELLSLSRGHAGSQALSVERPAEDVQGEAARPSEIGELSGLSFLAPSDDPAMIGRVGPYEISGFLGRGATGIVLRGFDRALSRNIAIKVLDPAIAGAGTARQRFAREARAMAVISHEHVVPVYGVDEHAGLPYFAMEYVAGGSLERRLKRDGNLDIVSIVRIGLQVAQALAEAHRHGLVHRDIKPANILIDRGTERVRVADFGLARVANDASCTHSGLLAGTPQYMAPEQILGETCSAQSDLFSLGGVMYAMSTGHAPFRAESVYAVMQRIVHEPPRAIREQNPMIPAWLEQFVLRLLEKDKAARFSSAEECASILQDELAGLSDPVFAPGRPRIWSQRRNALRLKMSRQALKIVCGVLCGAALAATGAAWLLIAQDVARHQQLEATRAEAEWLLRQHDSRMTANPQSEAAGALTSRLDEPRVSVPLWDADGTRGATDVANALDTSWHKPTRPVTTDPWSQQIQELEQRLAALLTEFESSGAPSPARGLGTSRKE
jgi:serine/threonine protein kinase